MAFRSNTSGFTGDNPPGSGIEWVHGIYPGPFSISFSYKINSTVSGSSSEFYPYYNFTNASGTIGSFEFSVHKTTYIPRLWCDNGVDPDISLSFSKTTSIGTWYDVAFTIDTGTSQGGTGIVKGCFGTSGDYNDWEVVSATNSPFSIINGSNVRFSIWFGCVGFSTWCDCSWDNVKAWSAALTPEQLRHERQKRLATTSNIITWIPCIDTSNDSALISLMGSDSNWGNWAGFTGTAVPPYMTTDSSPNGWGAAPLQISSIPTYYSFGYIIG